MSSGASYAYCITTIVTHKAIESMLEGSGQGSYRDTHPWLVASRLLAAAEATSTRMAILFASAEDAEHPAMMSHWAWIDKIDVIELHRGQWESRCTFDALKPVNPIWEPIDSLLIKPSQEQLDRESLEGIRVYRTALDEYHIHPYAICETPQFIVDSAASAAPAG